VSASLQMIDALLALTRGQAGLERRERRDLAALAATALLAREPEAAGAGLDIRATLAPAPATAGYRPALRRTLGCALRCTTSTASPTLMLRAGV
jgi:hypothetical protein